MENSELLQNVKSVNIWSWQLSQKQFVSIYCLKHVKEFD